MKNLYRIAFLLLFAGVIFAQENPQEKIWSKIFADNSSAGEVTFDGYTYIPAPNIPRSVQLRSGGEAIVYPNFRPFPTTNSTQSEMSIDIHPTNGEILFGGANATAWPSAGTIYGTGVYFTTNSSTALTWSGFDQPPFGSNSGDPAAAIGANGNFYIGYISAAGGQGVGVSTNNGVNWSPYTVAPGPSGFNDLLDKNHLMVDKLPTSPYVDRVYAAWTEFVAGSPINNKIAVRYSSNNGQSWSTSVNISAGVNSGSHDQGVNLQTGPNGVVYATWACYQEWAAGSYGEDAIGFNKSTDGGATWGTAIKAYTNANFGIRGNIKPTSIRVSSFPSMAVDRNNGNIYIVVPSKKAPAGNDPDIIFFRSTDGGTTWSSPVRVNDDPINNGKDQYYPWVTVDQASGAILGVYYDSRNVSNDSAEVYMFRSVDGGLTFENFKVSDAKFKPKSISGLASGYQGDYIGIAALNGIAWPYWADDRTGAYQGWIAKVTFGPTIDHTALGNTENLAGPYPVVATITSNLPVTSAKVFYGRGTSGQITDSVTMTAVGNTYTGNIPGNGLANTYNYYIKATDNAGGFSYFPGAGPTGPLSFVAATDVVLPVITHTAIGNQYRETWPVKVVADVTDNIGVDTVYVVYMKNNGTTAQFGLSNTTGTTYEGFFNIDTTQIALNDSISYRIVAKDASVAGNLGYHPSSTTFNTFKFVPDVILPVIDHTALRNQTKRRWPAVVSATVTDNLGIKSVVVEYTKPSAPTSGTFTLLPTGGNKFEAAFPFDTTVISVDDTIKYRIIATDNSTSANKAYSPATGFHAFKIIEAAGIVLVVNDDITLADRHSQDKPGALTDLVSPEGISSSMIISTLIGAGYVVDSTTFTALDTNVLVNYDILALTAGPKTAAMFDNAPKRTAIVRYTQNGGKTFVEGGEVGWIYRKSGSTTDKDSLFRKNLLLTETWRSDVSTAVPIRKIRPGHQFFSVPNAIPDSIATGLTGVAQRDAMSIIPGMPGIYKLTGWLGTYADTAGIIAYSPLNDSSKIRNIYFTFSLACVTNQAMAALMVENAFELLAGSGAIIPVELTSFAATTSKTDVTLSWATSTETNNSGFAIERKSGSGSFTQIGFVNGSGTTTEKQQYVFTDKKVPAGTHEYRLRQIDFDGTTSYSGAVAVEIEVPKVFALEQNYPNPFNPATTIKYSVPADGKVTLNIYNVLGEQVAQIINQVQKAGSYETVFDASKLSSGIYFYKLEAGSFNAVKKMILMK